MNTRDGDTAQEMLECMNLTDLKIHYVMFGVSEN